MRSEWLWVCDVRPLVIVCRGLHVARCCRLCRTPCAPALGALPPPATVCLLLEFRFEKIYDICSRTEPCLSRRGIDSEPISYFLRDHILIVCGDVCESCG